MATLKDLPSVNHPEYRRQLRGYMEATVNRIKDHPAVLAYQLLNEPRYDQKRLYDYNPYALAAFRQWLVQRYGELERLNLAWSASYASFEQAQPPREAPADVMVRSPLVRRWSDWREFGYDNLAGFVGELARAVKSVDPGHPVIVAEMA